MTLPEPLRHSINAAAAMYGTGRPIPADEAHTSIAELGITPDADYVEFIGRWGGCFVGVPVHAWENSSLLGNESCLELTVSAKQECGALIDGLVFALDGSGNPIWIGADGAVRIADHNNGDVVVLATSFRELLSANVHDG